MREVTESVDLESIAFLKILCRVIHVNSSLRLVSELVYFSYIGVYRYCSYLIGKTQSKSIIL